MMGRILDRTRRDEGMTIVEVVAAAFIMFFVLTAILGLVATTTTMGQRSKQRVAMVNAVNSYMEYVRSLDFSSVAISGTTTTAAIPASVVFTREGFTITISNTVTNDQNGNRALRISAVCTAPGYPTLTMTEFASIRDRERGMTQQASDPDKPLARWGNLTPEEDTVVYGANVAGGGSLLLQIEAESPSYNLSLVQLTCQGQPIRSDRSAVQPPAVWHPGTPSFTQSFTWDTMQIQPTIPDGYQFVRAIVDDDQGRETVVDRRFFVDNAAPSIPSAATVQVRTATSTLLTWPPTADGDTPASKYEVRAYKQPLSLESSIIDDYNSWTNLGVVTVSSPSHPRITDPFSRYMVEVRAGSPMNNWSAWRPIATPFVSRPRLTGYAGTYQVYKGMPAKKFARTTVSLSISSPQFATSAATCYLYRSKNDSSTVFTAPDSGFPKVISGSTYTEPIDALDKSILNKYIDTFPQDAYYYGVKWVFTPRGYSNPTPAASETIYSNRLGPTYLPAMGRDNPLGTPLLITMGEIW